MRQTSGCLLHLEHNAWRIDHDSVTDAPFVPFAASDLLEQPKLLVQRLSERDLLSQPIVIGLGTDMCLSATVPVASPQMLRKRTAMRYHLEEWIPWSAEDYVADYVALQNSAFMVATKIEPLRSFVRSLEELDVSIAAICPTTVLAVAEYLHDASGSPEEYVLGWQIDQQIELFVINRNQIHGWTRVSATVEAIIRELRAIQATTGGDRPLALLDGDLGLIEELHQHGIQVAPAAGTSLLDSASRMAGRIVAGTDEAPLELKRDELAGTRSAQRLKSEVSRLQLAVATLFVMLAAGLWLRGNLYQRALADVQSNLAEVHLELFPGKEIPTDVRAAVDQEYRQLQATRSAVPGVPERTDSAVTLQHLLAALPSDLRFRLPEIQIEAEHISLGGEVRSNTDADKIAAALRQGGFTVESPKTQRLADKGFSVRLSAKPGADTRSAKKN